MEQSKEIQQNWKGAENFHICFGVMFDHVYQKFISQRRTEH